jgi:DtxR family Mn-dependent transcriptional regulator
MEYHKSVAETADELSESEEMYLVTLALLLEAGTEAPVAISQLAHDLSIQPVSANQMVRKLEEAGLVEYEPYKGVSFTPEGECRARRVLRGRRLWEVFLVECLRVPPLEAGELACRLEHSLPEEVAERLSDYLGDPSASPQGDPIPRLDPTDPLRAGLPLSRLRPGEKGRVNQVEADPAARLFLAGEGIRPGAAITVLGVGKEGAVLVSVDGGPVVLAPGLPGQIWLEKS